MNMRASLVFAFVIAITTVAIHGSQVAARQELQPETDADAHAIYATLIQNAWSHRSKETLLLQRETETTTPCRLSPPSDPAWVPVYEDFLKQNLRSRLVGSELRVNVPYRLIARADIEADDARLAIKYPGQWQRRPESLEYAAVSAVGFSSDRTKAVVYLRFRSNGSFHTLERRGNEWVRASVGIGCNWIA